MGLPGGPRRPNTTAYFIALAGILVLLVLLFCYFIYFCIRKVKELTGEDSPLNEDKNNTPSRSSYPVQQGVRDSATAMAKLCKQLPAAGKGGTVFPAASSPAATHTDTGAVGDRGDGEERGGDIGAIPASPAAVEAGNLDVQDKVPAPVPLLETTAAAS